MAYANDLAPRDGKFRVRCLHHEKNIEKADGFVFLLDGNVWLLDGGMHDSEVTHEYLLALRRKWLGPEREYPLKLSWFVSHFHIDHVSVAIEKLIPDARFEFDTLYLPPETALADEFSENGVNGDKKHRPELRKALAAYGTGREKKINMSFGPENILEFFDESGRVKFTLYPPAADYGTGERLEYEIENYWKGDRKHRLAATSAVNSGSLWLRVQFGKNVFLFTGDSMKKQDALDKESADEMMRAYRDKIGKVDVIKYFHHGFKRDAGAKHIMSFDPEYIITTAQSETASAAVAKAAPGAKVVMCDCALRDAEFESDGEELRLKYFD